MSFTTLTFASLEVLSSTKMTQLYGNTAYFKSENAAPVGAWTFAPGSAIIPITIDQNYDAKSILIDSEATGSLAAVEIYAKQGMYIKQDLSNGYCMFLERGTNEAGANPLVTLYEPNASSIQPALYIATAGINWGSYILATGSTLGAQYLSSSNLIYTLAVHNTYKTAGLGAGIWIQNGTDDNSLTNIHITFADGNGDTVGSITSSGGTVSYNAFTGGHPSLERHDREFPFGYVMISSEVFHDLGIARKYPNNKNHQVVRITEPSQKAYDKKVFGVYAGKMSEPVVETTWDEKTEKYESKPGPVLKEKHQIYGVGDGMILVCSEGGNIERGDLITTSNMEGHGMKQDDDLFHNYTIAKSEEDIDWSKESQGTKLIACTYHAS